MSEAQGSSLKSEGFEPHIDTPAWGPALGRQAPLAGLETSEANQWAVGNRDSTLEESE